MRFRTGFILASLLLARVSTGAGADTARAWRPPFGLDRVGQPRAAGETAPAFEAEAVASPEKLVNPVDLGAILVPDNYLLLGPGQSGSLAVRLLQTTADERKFTIRAAFVSTPGKESSSEITLARGKPKDATLQLPTGSAERDVLRVSVVDHDTPIWEKRITVMRVNAPPALPAFGAIETKLRYDAPISVRDPKTGSFSTIPYDTAWDPSLKDVVVALPGGARLVFWRGASYIPLWHTPHGVAACTEWAEIISQPAGSTDCVEPLMDKELRYGRVRIVESTAARVHVRWTYQSNDLLYKVWGDQAVEDYYFYPDGFGTRVLTLNCDPAMKYELSEFIVVAPAETYPLSFVPKQPIDVLFVDRKDERHIAFPAGAKALGTPRDVPAVYRLHPHRDDRASLVYFSPRERNVLPACVFGAFFENGQMVTPAYWGSHWPLARGNATGERIDERVHVTPHHTSLMSWVDVKPQPLWSQTGPALDALGRSKTMARERWVWMLGMTDAPDEKAIERARSFASPPSVEALGATVDPQGYSEERRAILLTVEKPDVTLKLIPSNDAACVDPVLELDGARRTLAKIELDDRPVDASRFAWDGRVLWIAGTYANPVKITLRFQS